MLYPVSVVVPTLYGRTSALLYDVPQASTGVVLVERELSPILGGALVERVCDEVCLYLRTAGVSVLRLASPQGLGATHYAANIVGCVALLRGSGASRVVLIASNQEGSAPLRGSPASPVGPEPDGADVSQRAFEGFLELITARATTPAAYAQLIAELVDTIRDVIDAVVGVVHLTPRGRIETRGHAPPGGPSSASIAVDEERGAPPNGALKTALLAVNDPGSHDNAVGYIAQLYAWAQRLLREEESVSSPNARREPLERHIAQRRATLSETIWQTLDPSWREIVAQLAERKPRVAAALAEYEQMSHDSESRARAYGRAWVLFDQHARLDWLAACAKVFPLRKDSLLLQRTARDMEKITSGVDTHGLGGVG